MPKSIAEAQKGYDFAEGSNDFELLNVKNIFEQYGEDFLKILARVAEQRGVVASGKLLSNAEFVVAKDGSGMQFLMADYFDFPNEGVRGVKSSRNAPGSPYQFKSYGMNSEGRRAIRDYIEKGHAKIDTVQRRKYTAVGREGKQQDLIGVKVNQLIYLIKRFGIKKTGYFDAVLEQTFKDFDVKMAEAFGNDIVFSLEKKNR